MYKNYRIIINTAAGRRRYMRLLIPYVLQSDLIDRYDLWINTNSNADIAFFKEVAKISPKINLVWQPDGIVNGVKSINAFYKLCTEHDAIYFKLDDDIVWMEPSIIEKMVKYRVDNPDYFLVTPLVINNGFSTLLLSIHDKIKIKQNQDISICWNNGYFAYDIHNKFINNYLRNNSYQELYVNNAIIGLNRFSINAILWYGKDLDKISGIVPGDDEEFMSLLYPTREGLACSWNGSAIVSHFAFGSQREIMDSTDILDKYFMFAQQHFENNKIFEEVENAYKYVEENIDLINSLPPHYKLCSNNNLNKDERFTIEKYIPKYIYDFINYRKFLNEKNTREFIERF
jgi:hypothetical protein